MIVEEYKIDSTSIRIENEDIGTQEEKKEIMDLLLGIFIKKVSEYSQNDL